MEGDGVEEEDIDFVDTFKYLGFHFESGGDRWHHVEIRMAMAASAFGRLRHIWRDSRLSQRLKLRIYSTYIVSVLTWGLPAWRLGDVERRKLRGWNARLLTRLLGTEHENFGEVVRQQTREPLFDLVAKLRARRLRWLGHTLRLGEENLLRRVLTRGATPKVGSVLADEALPPHSSVEELAALAGNHVTKEGKQRAAAWGAMCAAVEGKSGLGLSANTAEETEAELAAIGGDQLRCYTDGGCDGNGAGGVWGASGWGVHVLGVPPPAVRAEMWGPVVIDDDSGWFCGATRGTNNTGEIIGIGQALMWLRDVDEATDIPAIMLFDSCYAANMVTGRWQPNANIALVEWARKLLADVEATGRTVHWVHVKGHSADGGNDRADELVQWGKTGGPYCRVREGGGEGEGRYGAATTAALATATEGDSALGEIYGSVPARRGFEAANAALNVFNSLSTGVNVCVLSNGVLLERQ
jgi:ribonuclease HI